ncbi:MAG: ABC-F family ATP-binding cassette domain-containing protein [Deltaproteobacteria bacterium]|nr:ABC-F family ATP-binding cassette domain-containing protein [Deltaproteobacteria bacterium]
MIGISRLGKSYGARTLFADVSLELGVGARYGLVGANGSGKTTLLRILAGEEAASDGSVHVVRGARLGVLQQDRFLDDAETVLTVAMRGDGIVWTALEKQRRLLESGSPDPVRLAEIEDVLHANEGHALESRAGTVLEGLGIPTVRHGELLGALSGGFKLRVLLAQVLLAGPDVLLLDEPTNHLDILSIRWLEKWLGQHRGCSVVISHDRRFLDNVATHVLDIDYGTVTLYPGDYTAFERQKQETRERKELQIARAEKEIAHKRAFVERFGAKNTKATQAQSRLKQIARIEEGMQEVAHSSRRAPSFRFEEVRPSGRDVLEVRGICKRFGSLQVLRDVSLVLRRGERMAVIGANGLGKSTLLRILVGRLDADEGAVSWGHEVRTGYFPQDHHEVLAAPGETALEFLWSICPAEPERFVRGQLGRLLFSGEDVDKPAGLLSGGEAARLVFSRLMVERPNVLLLDEPTNHLDLEAIGALTQALKRYEGTIVLVSHDRFFVSQLASRILELGSAGPRDFPGTYDEYLERCGDDHLDVDAVAARARRERAPRAEGTTAPSWEEQKRRRNQLKELPLRRDRALAALEQAEARRRRIHAAYADPGFYDRTSREELDALAAEDEALGRRIEELVAEWELLETALEEAAR